MLSTEMARSSALNFLNSGITIAYNDNWSVQTDSSLQGRRQESQVGPGNLQDTSGPVCC